MNTMDTMIQSLINVSSRRAVDFAHHAGQQHRIDNPPPFDYLPGFVFNSNNGYYREQNRTVRPDDRIAHHRRRARDQERQRRFKRRVIAGRRAELNLPSLENGGRNVFTRPVRVVESPFYPSSRFVVGEGERSSRTGPSNSVSSSSVQRPASGVSVYENPGFVDRSSLENPRPVNGARRDGNVVELNHHQMGSSSKHDSVSSHSFRAALAGRQQKPCCQIL
jgi:hypothetical protein